MASRVFATTVRMGAASSLASVARIVGWSDGWMAGDGGQEQNTDTYAFVCGSALAVAKVQVHGNRSSRISIPETRDQRPETRRPDSWPWSNNKTKCAACVAVLATVNPEKCARKKCTNLIQFVLGFFPFFFTVCSLLSFGFCTNIFFSNSFRMQIKSL